MNHRTASSLRLKVEDIQELVSKLVDHGRIREVSLVLKGYSRVIKLKFLLLISKLDSGSKHL